MSARALTGKEGESNSNRVLPLTFLLTSLGEGGFIALKKEKDNKRMKK
jgi:hypothetical protein